ncbi:cytochrome P450 [Granulicella mallensis]|uniref:Cytochrome P450 n=1 Tax=Granulicella mallensis (strain ATCC BAA-1857 / DSM 23137 / MP5ACTX8) TaxID=682795 RepID=G8NQE3_GRAMM|nr:cytochrome P450 [Granulicella mallensis]AEU36092.1 cytochrome P450 [Granulicella mallensis MP5ACTX8]
MQKLREESSIPAWSSDEFDSPVSPHIEPAYFDKDLDAWVLSRYEDVLAAFRSSGLGNNGKSLRTTEDDEAMEKMRAEAREALSPAQLRAWSEVITPIIQARAQTLPEGSPVDLLDSYVRPNCLDLAALVTGIDPQEAARLRTLAGTVSAAAAEPYDPALRAEAKSVTPALQACFHARAEALRDSGFVALSHTLPCMLANAFYALLQNPQQWALVHLESGLIEQAIEELMRHAGLGRFLRRQATEDLVIGDAFIRQGDRLILRIIAANHDPVRFAQPHELDVCRRGAAHFTLGAGSHACVGASLLRMASVAMLRPLVELFSSASLTEPVTWQGGSGFRSPKNLPVVLRRDVVS